MGNQTDVAEGKDISEAFLDSLGALCIFDVYVIYG